MTRQGTNNLQYQFSKQLTGNRYHRPLRTLQSAATMCDKKQIRAHYLIEFVVWAFVSVTCNQLSLSAAFLNRACFTEGALEGGNNEGR